MLLAEALVLEPGMKYVSWGVLPWVYPIWDSLGFLDLSDYFLPHFREVFNYYLLILLSPSSHKPLTSVPAGGNTRLG